MGGKLGSLAAMAKEKLGGAADTIKGVFAKDERKGKPNRTSGGISFEELAAEKTESAENTPQPQPAGQPSQPAQPVQQPSLEDFGDDSELFTQPAQPAQPAQQPVQQRFSPKAQSQPEDSGFAQEEPAPRQRPQGFAPRSGDSSLPTRWDARSQGSDLYFSSRMSDEGYKIKEPASFEEKKRPAYQGRIVDLSRRMDEDPGEETYYVPSIDVGDSNRRTRYKRRNRKPLLFWQKATITGVCITAAFIGLITLTVNLMLIGKMNHINVGGSRDMNDLYFYEPNMVTSILDDSVSIDQEDRSRLTNLNDAFNLPDLAEKYSKEVQNFLVVALDEDDEADAMVIVSVDSKTKKIRLVNILPELYVPLADQIGGVSYGSSLRKIYAYGGAKLLRKTVEDAFKVSVDHYFVMGYTAFETVVNHLGGADITITDEAVSYWMATNKYEPQNRFGGTGRFTLNGEEALIYSRMSQLDGPFARAARQQEIFAKLCERVQEYGTLELVSALYNALSYVTTDCPASKMLSLCGKLDDYSQYEVKGFAVPIEGTYTEGYVGGEYLLASNITVNANDIQLFLYSNDMTYADGGVEVNVMVPEVSAVLDVPEVTVSESDAQPAE